MQGPASGALIAVVSAHVAAPHQFPNYFTHDWLRHVRDSDCRTLLETRSKDGKVALDLITSQSLSSGFRHSTLDVAAFVLDEKASQTIAKLDLPILTLDTDESASTPTRIGQDVTLAGFQLIGESGCGTEAVVGVELHGTISEESKSRAFVNTGDMESEMGMCGGPVVKRRKRNVCVGVVEGLVPRPQHGEDVEEMHRRVAGHTVLIGAKELGMFLHDVEREAGKNGQEE